SGIYTAHARRLAHTMAQAGCARRKIGPLMAEIAAVFGVKVDRQMSWCTVSRAILEGGVAASMQMVYEIALTISADSTSHRGNNYESRHISMRAPDYVGGIDA
ncbi:hypothetical protein DFH08DRAFT_623914, partial [Mycena albidolilacea]